MLLRPGSPSWFIGTAGVFGTLGFGALASVGTVRNWCPLVGGLVAVLGGLFLVGCLYLIAAMAIDQLPLPETRWERTETRHARQRLLFKEGLGLFDQEAIAWKEAAYNPDAVDDWVTRLVGFVNGFAGFGEATRVTSNAGITGVSTMKGWDQRVITNLENRRERIADLIARADTIALSDAADSQSLPSARSRKEVLDEDGNGSAST